MTKRVDIHFTPFGSTYFTGSGILINAEQLRYIERGDNYLGPALGFASNAQADIAMTADAVDETKLSLAIPDITSSLADLLSIMILATAKQ